MFAEIKARGDRLHEVERDIAQNLYDRPLHTWCEACVRLFRRLHQKACSGS